VLIKKINPSKTVTSWCQGVASSFPVFRRRAIYGTRESERPGFVAARAGYTGDRGEFSRVTRHGAEEDTGEHIRCARRDAKTGCGCNGTGTGTPRGWRCNSDAAPAPCSGGGLNIPLHPSHPLIIRCGVI
jgi:hypothetical protein